MARKVESQVVTMSTVSPTALLNGDVQVTSTPDDDLHPGIANDNSGNLVLGFEADLRGEGEYNVWFTSSPDGGVTWADNAVAWMIEEPPEYPSVDYCGEETRFGGTMVPHPWDNDGSSLYLMKCVDPANIPDGYSMVYWTWNDVGEGYTNFKSTSIGCDNAVEDWALGGTSIIGDHGSGLTETPFFSYQFTEEGMAWIYYFTGEMQNCQVTSTDIDPITHESYSIWNYLNQETGVYDIFFYKFDFATWEPYDSYQVHPDLGGGRLTTSANDEYPDVSARNDNVIILAQTDANVNKDIVCYYSFNGMNTFETSFVTSSSDDELYPEVTHTGDNQAICTFVKNGNLYGTRTEDGGATWSDPVKVNDIDGKVASEYHTASLCEFGVVWMDNRNDNYDIYFDTVGAAPVITIKGIAGGIGVSAVVANIGTADATNVDWTITIDAPIMIIGHETTGTIATLPAGGEETIKSGLVLGFGPCTITVTADSATATAKGWVIGPFVLFVK
jgi:hypothetical protein